MGRKVEVTFEKKEKRKKTTKDVSMQKETLVSPQTNNSPHWVLSVGSAEQDALSQGERGSNSSILQTDILHKHVCALHNPFSLSIS